MAEERLTSQVQPAKLDVLLERVGALQTDITDIKCSTTALSSSLSMLRENYLVEHEKLVAAVRMLSTKVDEHDKVIDDLEKKIEPLMAAHKILVWVAGILGGSIIVLIWMVITHQAIITLP